jgi:septal ring-binding cell division protein DamX
MWGKKRQRYVFRKHSRRGRVLWPVVCTLILVGLMWFIPWQSLSSVGILDTLRSEAAEDQSEQAPLEDQTEQASAEDQTEQPDEQDQPEQEDTSEQSVREADVEGTPLKEEEPQNILTSPSPPATATAQAVQLSPPQTPSTPRIREVPQDFSYSNDYWYAEPDYWDY